MSRWEHVRRRLDALPLSLAIRWKWWWDCHRLPLSTAHRVLYEIIHRLCWRELGEFPNLIDCRDFNDRIQWLKLFDQTREIVRCSDKILVRDFVRGRVGEQYLVNLYQVHDYFDQVDFDALPNSFVIKTNHDSGTVVLVRAKDQFDCQTCKLRFESALKKSYGWSNGEWAYSYVQPKIFVEAYINSLSTKPPSDYKFYCVDGKVKFCHYIYDRGFDTKEQTVDSAGNDLATELYPSFKLGTDFKKPEQWDQMIWVAEQLSQGFKCVRVDLFCTEEHIYAGEMTFWPMAGVYRGEGQKILGQLLDFDRTTYKPFLLPELEAERSRFSLYQYEKSEK